MKTTRKKALFYCRINRDDKANAGVIKKCKGQVAGLRQLGWKVDMIWFCKDGVLLNERIIVPFKRTLIPHSWISYFFYFFQWHDLLLRKLKVEDYSFIYVRYEMSHPNLLYFFKRIKQENRSAKLILEIPTFPYTKELKGVLRKAQLFLDFLFRGQLKKYADLVTSYGIHTEIFGIPALSFANGIALEEIPIASIEPNSTHIRMIAVGYWRFWHGLDRLIRGLANYYKECHYANRKVSLTIVGAGEDLGLLKNLASQYNVAEHVFFIKPLTGKALAEEFNKSDVGVGSLGLHRIGLITATPLKNRDYCARGLPFIFSTPDPDFPETLPWVKSFPSDNSPIPIGEIITFVEKSKKEIPAVSIRQYAEEKLSWKSRMFKVIERIEKIQCWTQDD